jgi:hypothetical protein
MNTFVGLPIPAAAGFQPALFAQSRDKQLEELD